MDLKRIKIKVIMIGGKIMKIISDKKEFALKEAIVDAAAIFLPKKNGENDD